MSNKKLYKEIKAHIENWQTQCGYDIPFDFEGLRSIISNKNNLKSTDKIKKLTDEIYDLQTDIQLYERAIEIRQIRISYAIGELAELKIKNSKIHIDLNAKYTDEEVK